MKLSVCPLSISNAVNLSARVVVTCSKKDNILLMPIFSIVCVLCLIISMWFLVISCVLWGCLVCVKTTALFNRTNLILEFKYLHLWPTLPSYSFVCFAVRKNSYAAFVRPLYKTLALGFQCVETAMLVFKYFLIC